MFYDKDNHNSHTILVGWILTLRKLGDIFDVPGFNTWNLVMTVLMCITWIILFVLTALAFWEGKIFISPPEAVIRDSYAPHLTEKSRERDPELGINTDVPPLNYAQPAMPEMSYTRLTNQRSFFDTPTDTPVISSHASTVTAHY